MKEGDVSLRVEKVTLPRQPRKGRGAKAGHRERVAARQQQAMRLRVAGASYASIANALGVSKQQAFRDCTTALTETLTLRDSAAERYRELECARLDALLVACWPRAQAGSAEHVRAAVRIAERRARLLGLDAAVASKLELTGTVAVPDERFRVALADESVDSLVARAEKLRAMLAEMQLPELVAETQSTPLTAEERYASVLAERRAAAGPAH
jgi:hypothetical protein